MTDRDFRPRRRGFSDDNYELPPRNYGYPAPRDPQGETPSGPPIQATVKWYNATKGFGFVTLVDGSGDAFLHARVVERSGSSAVLPGATLEVRAGPGSKGLQVVEILSVDNSSASPEPRGPRYGHRPDSSDERPTVEELGTVSWYNPMKGFGFIAPDRGGRDIFVHVSALERSGVAGIAEGQRVAIDVADGHKGPETVRLRLI